MKHGATYVKRQNRHCHVVRKAWGMLAAARECSWYLVNWENLPGWRRDDMQGKWDPGPLGAVLDDSG